MFTLKPREMRAQGQRRSTFDTSAALMLLTQGEDAGALASLCYIKVNASTTSLLYCWSLTARRDGAQRCHQPVREPNKPQHDTYLTVVSISDVSMMYQFLFYATYFYHVCSWSLDLWGTCNFETWITDTLVYTLNE